jgi:hypothetical protein
MAQCIFLILRPNTGFKMIFLDWIQFGLNFIDGCLMTWSGPAGYSLKSRRQQVANIALYSI